MVKQELGRPINVLFVCHDPAFWSMFESVYFALARDPKFAPTIVTLPYRHSTLPQGEYKDAGMFEFLQGKGIEAIRGYNEASDKWASPESFAPDYIFFQQPYRLFPPEWAVERVSLIAKVCYIPYGTLLAKGELEEVVHPEDFFQYTALFFKESASAAGYFRNQFHGVAWFDEGKVRITGHPKYDYLREGTHILGGAWPRGMRAEVKRVLWTPRWRTSEGTCHFFDYRFFFRDFCKTHGMVDFVLRPHSLMFQNFVKNREMSETALAELRAEYKRSPNMSLDESGDYRDTFLSSDILVSDLSSLLLEYLATGKPIIYTHRTDLFNEIGRELSKGLYWVRNATELKETLEMLLSGKDPLEEKRTELMKALLFLPEGGAGMRIKCLVKQDFALCAGAGK